MKIIANNRKSSRNYQILEKFETGICLTGTEIKSLRANRVRLDESFGTLKRNELFLVNTYIPEYEQGNRFNHNPVRQRKLLAHRAEIRKMHIATSQKGLTLIPLRMYFKGRWVKIEMAVCRGKAKSDKRQDAAKKEADREISRAIKNLK
jgi:SsrA-binding protein